MIQYFNMLINQKRFILKKLISAVPGFYSGNIVKNILLKDSNISQTIYVVLWIEYKYVT